MTASSTANASQCVEQQFAHLTSQQKMMHKNMHQIIAQVNALSFNQSNAGCGRVASNNFEGNGGCNHGHEQRPCGPQNITSNGGQFGTGSDFTPATKFVAPNPPSGHMKARRNNAPLVLECQGPPRASSMECRCSTARPQLHF
jgi:hypothetical protein